MENREVQSAIPQKESISIPFLTMFIASLVMLVAFFLPYASATEDHKKSLEHYAGGSYIEEFGMGNKDAVNISLFEYARIYAFAASSGQSRDISIACLTLIAVCGIFTLLTTLFSILKKPIVVIIFDVISFGAYYLLAWDFNDRGVLPSSNYNLGFSYYILYIGAAVIFIGAIWMLVVKIQKKRAIQATNSI